MQIIDLKKTAPKQVLAQAIACLHTGGLVIFPTETTYGAGVDALNQAAVGKLLAYKSRREGKPLSIACADQHMAEKYVVVNNQARRLYTRFLPGPVTVVSEGRHVVARGVESEFGTLGVRIPDYPLILELVRSYGRPITATSANASGEKRPYSLADIFAGLSEKQKGLIDLVLDAGELLHNPPSTVIDTTLSAPVTLRQGEVTLQQEEGVLSSAIGTRSDGENNRSAEWVTGSSMVWGAGTTAPPSTILSSSSEEETMGIAGRLMLKHWDDIKTTGLVIGLDGSLGMGKTIFAKGVAQFLQISETITSPTYTYIEEYPFHRYQTHGTFYHIDAWKINTRELYKRLGIGKLIGKLIGKWVGPGPGKVVVIEWWSQIESFGLEEVSGTIVRKLPFIHVLFQEGEDGIERILEVKEEVNGDR